jgi:hypothetical protein
LFKYRATIAVPHKSSPAYVKSMLSPTEKRKTSRPPNPRRRQEIENIQPFTIWAI